MFEGLVSCGGSSTPTSCATLGSGGWEQSHVLLQVQYSTVQYSTVQSHVLQERRLHTGWASPRGLLLLGGLGSPANTTTELLTSTGGSEPAFSLDYETM